jgi:hypothetical protein
MIIAVFFSCCCWLKTRTNKSEKASASKLFASFGVCVVVAVGCSEHCYAGSEFCFKLLGLFVTLNVG